MKICTVDGCENQARRRGLCGRHHHRLLRHGDPLGGGPDRSRTPKECAVDDCSADARALGYCVRHYQKLRAHGSPTAGIDKYATPEESFAARTAPGDGGCIVWTGTLSTDGYGRIYVNNTNMSSHRYAWQRVNGPVPKGLVIDHTCFNRACVNVSHMRTVTRKQNTENREGPEVRNKSGYRGVHWHKGVGKWRVKVTSAGVEHHGGYFDDLELANEAAIDLRAKVFTHNLSDRR